MGRAVRWWRLSSAGAVVPALLVAGLLARTGARPEALPAGPAPAPGCASSVPYVAGVGGYAAYRIPAVVRTRAGALLAFAEGRRGGTGDSGAIDIVVRRSTDGGCGWDPARVVTAGRGDTRGNPAPVVDPSTGDVVLVSSYNDDGAVTEAQILAGRAGPDRGRRVFVQRSRDDGRSFTAPREITSEVTRPGWRWYATGPGHALALTRGAHAGRLLVPANHSVAPPAGSPDTGREPRHYGAHALYSDDGGRSWSVGYVDDAHDGVVNANESSAAQLDDGRIYFTARDQHGTSPGNRAAAVSSDGGASLDRPYAPQPALAAMPVVQGSVLHLGRRGDGAGGRGDVLLFSGPSVPDVRARMAIWRSTDGGRSAARVLTLSPRPAAYSDLVRVDAETVGLLYETGTRHPYESVAFRRVPLDVVAREVLPQGSTRVNIYR